MPVTFLLFLAMFLFPVCWPFLALYILWLFYDRAPANGGRPIQWVRHLRFWKHIASYFPVTIVKEEELDPNTRYVFGYHPHGIISHGALMNFGTEGTNFSKVFKGLKLRLLTLETNFRIPLYRDLLLALGLASVSLQSCTHILNMKTPTSIVIVVGGAAEALEAHARTNNLTLRKRKGFIKVAIRNGAPLVPVFSFGENDLYNQFANPKGSRVRRFQEVFCKYVGVSPPVFYGRGIFNYDFGILPHRKQVATVFGKAIKTEKNLSPSEEYINEIQEKYIEELQRIYDKYKNVYAADRSTELIIKE
ncbi:diacylglycerol O-acyltransferase [Planoprotostelium fungivorum]|uniref:Acyltransferase n=1 Tax=Planoprotostelium fungivorum TaxID=1890364 RepID=A0A2P6NXK0_9EUKA|nr:diacylglycerol O-acyltransferase [Planoprotostelium fungivorum]